jgi:hypothetical protein
MYGVLSTQRRVLRRPRGSARDGQRAKMTKPARPSSARVQALESLTILYPGRCSRRAVARGPYLLSGVGQGPAKRTSIHSASDRDRVNLCRGVCALFEARDDIAEIGVGVREEALDAGAELAEAGLAVGGLVEAVLGTVAVAGEAVGARFAIVGQHVPLVAAELPLLR